MEGKEIKQQAEDYANKFNLTPHGHTLAASSYKDGITSDIAKEYWEQELGVKELNEEISRLINKYEYKSIKGGI